MGLLNSLKTLFAGGSDHKPEDASAWFYVRCRRCGEVIRVRVDMRNDPSADDDGQHVVRKTLVGGARRCFARLEMTLTFDANRRLQSQEVTGGDFVSADDYATQKAEVQTSGEETIQREDAGVL